MTYSSPLVRRCLFVALVSVAALVPSRSRAAMPDGASLLDYGFRGFTLGAELGLSIGYISTGPKYESGEWKALVMGLGIGALAGMTTGLVVAVADATGEGSQMGYFILRDAGYGTLLGATMGALIGLLLWVDDGSSKDVLKGAAWGCIVGSVVGGAYGVIEGINAEPKQEKEPMFGLGGGWRLRIAPAPVRAGPGAVAALSHAIDL